MSQRTKKICSVMIFSLCLLNVGNTFVFKPTQPYVVETNEKNPIAMIYIIEFQDILCSPCCESFLDFCFLLPPQFREENTCGIIVFGHNTHTNLGNKIIAKKVRGFMNGNQLHFPVFIDFSNIFKTLRTQATHLYFLDSTSLTVKMYDFPLTEVQKNAILQAVFEGL